MAQGEFAILHGVNLEPHAIQHGGCHNSRCGGILGIENAGPRAIGMLGKFLIGAQLMAGDGGNGHFIFLHSESTYGGRD